jgi:hypothetical protein
MTLIDVQTEVSVSRLGVILGDQVSKCKRMSTT